MKYLKKLIIFLLTLEAKAVLWRFRPKIIAVVGSVGKTSTKDAIYTALKDSVNVRKNEKSFNSDIGAPLTILGLQNGWNSPLLWAKNLLLGLVQLCSLRYPSWLVLEVGADMPHDVERLAKWIRPHIVVVTSLPDIPVHVEFFESPEALIKEDLSIIQYMRKGGMLIINADEAKTAKVIEEYKVQTMTYGSVPSANVRFDSDSIVYDHVDGIPVPTGVSCKIAYNGNTVPLGLHGVLGITHIYPLVAALAVGLSMQIPFLTMTTALSTHQAPRGRMNIIGGKNGVTILDDTYNSSPVAVERALETLVAIETPGNKIAVLGDMLDLGKYTESEHARIGTLVATHNITYLVAVGMHSKHTAEAARKAGMQSERVMHVNTSDEAAEIVAPLLKAGDVMLVKGSQGVRTERVVAACMANPAWREKLLVRQELAWEKR
jgi:UDP-N-acetylmuramoyl-tripeptide--D-alanyl-D-alanine ligase